jgi:hypothetical protein
MINSSDCNLITFKAISTFINELAEIFANDHHPLKLYTHLINKTTISHEIAIKKHIDSFREFCLKNREALTSKNYKKLTKNTVEYSNKVYIDFYIILSKADSDTKNVIWNHLLTISALVDPAGKAKEILKQESGKEADFLTDIINKVEDNIDPNNTNPMEAVSSIISSGIFTDLISGMNSGMNDGSLDLGKLMGTVQKMCSSLGDMNKGGAGKGDETMNMINSLVNNMVSGSIGSESGPSDSPVINIANILNIQKFKNNETEKVSSSIDNSKIEEL